MDPLLLAASEYTPPPGTAEWIAIAVFLIVAADRGFALMARFKPPVKQQREIVGDSITVKAAVSHATADDLKRLEHGLASMTDRLDNIHRHMDTSREKILEAGEERMGRITSSIATLEANLHNRVTDVANRVSHLEGVIEVIRAKK